jgi:hypothetical protein
MADMDIEMDLDIGYTEDELGIPEIDTEPTFELSVRTTSASQNELKADIYPDQRA